MQKLNQFTLISLILGSVFYFFSYSFLDLPIAKFFHDLPHTYFVYTLYPAGTLLGSTKFALAFIVLSLFCSVCILFKKPQSKFANLLLAAGIALIVAIIVDGSLKFLLGRYRPIFFFQQGLYGFHYLSFLGSMHSTPSGHATHAFVLATGLSLIWKRLIPVFVLLGLFVCLSRLALEFHYLSDVIFGSLLGTLITLWVAKFYSCMTLSDHFPCHRIKIEKAWG